MQRRKKICLNVKEGKAEFGVRKNVSSVRGEGSWTIDKGKSRPLQVRRGKSTSYKKHGISELRPLERRTSLGERDGKPPNLDSLKGTGKKKNKTVVQLSTGHSTRNGFDI